MQNGVSSPTASTGVANGTAGATPAPMDPTGTNPSNGAAGTPNPGPTATPNPVNPSGGSK